MLRQPNRRLIGASATEAELARPKLHPPDFIMAPLKVGALAALPLLVGLEIGDRVSASGVSTQIEPESMSIRDARRAFEAELAEGYARMSETLQQSTMQQSANDWADAEYFALKGMAADRGENDGPERIDNWTLEPSAQDEIASERDKLLAALDAMPEIQANADVAAARAIAAAQVNFDCWVERSEEAAKATAQARVCRQAFETALSQFDDAVRGRGMTAANHRIQP